ncbi:MAG: hypothetical protein JXX29_13725 [Deltaproteobacteria bacterium]|nr:hypothetical protein [Deltaproteobacteria bacterium]MBN2672736.1 hypothetical protein [Deltaproteobacteria bacterium]
MKAELHQTSHQLVQPPKVAAEEFAQKSEAMAALGSEQFRNRTDVNNLVGEKNIQMAHDNNRNFARFMIAMFENYTPDVFVETVLWVFRAYRAHGFQTTYWPANLNIWLEILKTELQPETYKALYPFYNWLIINIPLFAAISDNDIAKLNLSIQPTHPTHQS